MKHFFIIIIFISFALNTFAIDWDTITNSDQYYYGVGTADTEQEAGNAALDNMLQMIAVHVVSDFVGMYDGTNSNGRFNHKESVRQCVQTYAQSPLTNVQTWSMGQQKNGMFTVRKYMLRSDLEKMYEERINRLKGMVRLADKSLSNGSIDIALQHYYWAYTLLRSLQFPNKVTNERNEILMDVLPATIKDILANISVKYVGRNDSDIDLLFLYKGQPTTVDFTYNDGRADGCDGKAEGGDAYVEMAYGHENDEAVHINIEYEYKNWARGDVEMQSVLKVIPRANFGKEYIVPIKDDVRSATPEAQKPAKSADNEHYIDNQQAYSALLDKVIAILRNRQYDKAASCFSGRGLSNYLKLVRGRNGKIVGEPKMTFYTGAGGKVLARGLRMAFSATERGHKTTYVDDVIFTFDADGSICNLTFGIGNIAENDLLTKNVTWGEDVRQQILDFLENYKTAYCLKDTAYIRAIFDDNATIIVGHVAKRTTRPGLADGQMSDLGRDIVTYRQYSKSQYLERLKRTCERNNFINIKFTNNDVMKMENEHGQVFSIQIGQEYNSSTYADKGYLFLMVDMTTPNEPLIKIRTWQPKPDPEFGLYGPGHFYK